MNTRTTESSFWLRSFSKLMVVVTLALIFLGGQVKSHDAGLAVPDWPTTYEENMFLFHPSKWVGNIYHEHLHRVVAASVGFLSIILAVWLGLREHRRWVRWLGYGALGAVILQGVLGGITVLFLLPTAVSVSHAVLAQTFFVMVIVIAYALSKERRARASNEPASAWTPLTEPALYLVALVFVQLVLGALMRHTESGLAIPDFPTMGGQYLPLFTPDTLATVNAMRAEMDFVNGQPLEPVTLGQVWIHFIHRLGALLVVGAAAVCSVIAFRNRGRYPSLWRTVLFVDILVGSQAALGIATVLSVKTPWITSLHVATGAALLGLTVLLALRALPLSLRAEGGAANADMRMADAR